MHFPGSGQNHSVREKRQAYTALLGAFVVLAPAILLAQSGPTLPHGGSFVAGAGTIGPAASGSLNIAQTSARGVIDWNSFSIGAGGRVLINNGSGATLSRVTGTDLSHIDGLLKATGSLYLINRNGIVIGAKGCVLTDGTFVASTRNIATAAFMAGGPLTAAGTSAGDVSNNGAILAREGDVVLIGRSVANAGSITAPAGTATLATGDRVLLTTIGGPQGVYVAPDTGTSGNLTQSGRIQAAAAALKAGGGDIYTLAGNRTGLISATGSKTINGEVWLSAPNGKVVAAGDISAQNADGTGGKVIANGANVTVASGARISAQGSSGGTVLVGVSTPGGTDLAASTIIAAGASIQAGGPAGGGLIETSGHTVAIGKAHIGAGQGGLWRVDPVDLTIDSNAASTIVSTLNGGTNVSEQTTATAASGAGTQTAGAGDINVAAPINWSGTGSLNLSAYHDLNLNAAISGTGAFTGQASGAVNVNAGVSASNVQMTAGGDLTLGSGVTVAGANGVTLQTTGRFLNNAGANALSAGSGHWQVYSTDPSADTTGGLTPDFLQYAAPGGTTPAASGNGLLYSLTPSLSVALSGTVEKTYDGTTAAAFTGANASVSGLINNDAAAVTGSYASKNAGSGLTVTASSIAATHSGIPVYGYAGTNPSVSASIGQIDPATLTASIVGDPTKTYNGTTTAELGSANYQVSGFMSGESASVNQPSSVGYDSANAGARTVSATFSPTNFVPQNGTNLSNYVLPASATGPGQINPAPLLISGVLATDKTYDRTTTDNLSTGAAALYGVIDSDDVSLVTGGATGAFASPNVGSSLPVIASGFTLTGTKAGNYALTQPAGLLASINPAQLTISGVAAVGKVYDGTNIAGLNTSGAALNGVVSGDSLALGTASATGTFATSDVGTGIAVTASGFGFSGTGASNYRMSQPGGLSAAITPKTLAAAIVGTPTKTYNGDAGATLNSSDFSLTGFVNGQSGSIAQTSHVAYATPDAGTQAVTATLAVSDYLPGSGTKLSNYVLPASATGTGVINPAPVTISLVGDPTKTYDGNTSATLNSSNFLLSGFLSGQSATVTQTAGTYDSANAGLRQVTAALSAGDFSPGSGTTLTNYSFPTAVTGFGTIIPAPIQGGISAGIIGNPTKTYDGTTVATLNPANFQLSGFAQGQGATVTQTVGTYASKNVGVQPVTATLSQSDFTPDSGTILSNYTLPSTAYGSGTINPAVLSAAIIGTPTKVYNGTTDAKLTSANFDISGLASGESINISNSVQGAYDAKQAGARTVTAAIATTDITPGSGTLLSNYVLPANASGPGTINVAPVSILGVAAQNKTYDTTTAAGLSTGGAHLFGVVGSDNVTLSTGGANGVFATPNAGSGIAVTASGFSISGSDASNYQLFQPAGLAATIFQAPLAITGVNAINKLYDNTTTAALDASSAALSGVLSADNGQVGLVTSGATASFSSVNVGNGLAVAAGGFSLNGGQAANYALSQPSGLTANINAKPLTAVIIGNPTKVYDGSSSTTLTAANYQLQGFVSGQGASLPQSATVQYVSPNAGTQGIQSTLVSSDFVANGGTNLANYVLPATGSGTGTITPAPLTAAVIGNPTKQYDSTAAATLSASNYTLSGFISGQNATVTQTAGIYAAPDAGTRSVTANLGSGDFTAGGSTNLSNYSLPTSATGPGTITKAPLQVVNVAGTNRTYNGGFGDTLDVSSASVSGLFNTDSVNLNTGGATGVFASKDVGTGIGVTASGFTMSGGQSADYTLAQPTGLSANITQATLNLVNVTRQYDSTTGLPSASSAYTLSGIFGSDNVSVNTSGLTGSYADKNVNSGKSVTLSGLALGGAQASDYTIVSSLTNAGIGTITPAPLTVTGVVAQNKVYDATRNAGLDNSGATLFGLFSGDAVTLDSTNSSALFSDKNVGNGKTVTASGYTASGADFGNYTFTQPSGLSANITPFSGLTLTSVTKTYDGGLNLPTASTAYGLGGVIPGDNVQVATGSLTGGYASANVNGGPNISVNVSGLALAGTDANNYSIGSSVSNANIGIINPKSLSAAIIGTPTKTYDTTTAATLGVGNFNLSGFVSGEGATVSQTAGTYASRNAGTGNVAASLASSDFTPNGGTLLTNYTLPTSASGTGKINQAPVTITGVAAADKTYDRGTADTLNKGAAALSGVYASDASAVTLNTAAATGTFASPTVGTGIAVTASNFTISGSQAGNYALAQPTGLAANIAQATVNLASVSKVYDATTAATGAGVTYTLSGVVGGDVVSLSTAGLAGNYAAKNFGAAGLDVSLTGLSLTGAQAGNYTIASSVTNDPIGTITKAPLTIIGAQGMNKVYDATNTASLNNTSTALSGVLGTDNVTLSSATSGTFSSANAGTWTVTPGTYSVSGTDAGNYNLSQPIGLSATITRAPLTATVINNPTKIYDGGTTATLNSGNYSLSGFVGLQGANVTQTAGTYSSSDAGTPTVTATLTAGNFTPTGGAILSNYTLPTSASGSGTINPKTLAVGIINNPTKSYDGGTAATLNTGNYSLTGFVGSQGATVNQTTGTYGAANAGSENVTATLSAGNFAPTNGANLADYVLPTTASGTGTINPKTLTAGIINDPTKVYDGGTTAFLVPGDYSLTGFIGSDGATVNQTAGTYGSANAGTPTVTAALTAGNFTATGGANLSNYVLPATASGAGTINPKTLTATIINDPTKTYDGGTSAMLNSGNYSLSGFVGAQGATVTQAAGTYDVADAGSRTVTATLAAGNFTPTGGGNLSNYVLPATASGAGTIDPKSLTIGIVNDPAKTYDGGAGASLTPGNYQLSGFVNGQGATVSQSAGSYDSADAGSRTVTATLSAGNFNPTGGANLSNYTLPTTATGAGTIDPQQLSATIISNPTKTYDGGTNAALGTGNYQLAGFVGGQGATVSQSAGTYDTADAGSRTVSATLGVGDFTATGGANFANYVLPTTASGAGTINPKTLTAAITGAVNKTYDGTDAAMLASGDYTLTGFVSGQGATVTQTAGTYDVSDAGARTVTAALASNDFSPAGGTTLANYALPLTAQGPGTINPKQVTAAITGNPTRVYDGTTAATLAPSDYTLSGFVSGQGAAVTQTGGTYDAADAGSRTAATTLAGGDFAANYQTNLANYTLPTSASGPGTINPKTLTAVIAGNPTRTYDGTTAAVLDPDNYSLSGFIGSQGASVNQTAGAYDSADAGSRTVTAAFGAGDFSANNGTNLANYALPANASGPGTINQKALAATITGNPTKPYDGGTSAALTPGSYTLSGFVNGQGATVTQAAGTYDAADAGARTVTAALGAGDFAANFQTNLANYVLPGSATGAGTIDPAILTATIVNAAKTYDGTTAALLTPGNYVLTGFAPGQSATVTQTAGLYAVPDAGQRGVTASLSAADLTLTAGTNPANYVLPSSATGTGSIGQRPLSIAITGMPAKIYDGTTAAALTAADYTLSGFVAGQSANVLQSTGFYDSPNAGTRSVIAVLNSFAAPPGTNLANYLLPLSASGPGSIVGRPLTAIITGVPTKMKDGTLLATLSAGNFALSGFLTGQGATVTRSAGAFDSIEAGSRIVTALLGAGDFSPLTGTLLSNYVLPTSAIGAGLITPAVLTNAPTIAEAITSNLTVRNMGTPIAIANTSAQAAFGLVVPRTYIPYPAPSTLSTWQNAGFGSLPTIVEGSGAGGGVSATGDRSVNTGPPVINTTEQILLQGGKNKSWQLVLPPTPDVAPKPAGAGK